jgi:NADH-quinone oxidoreductase subunit G
MNGAMLQRLGVEEGKPVLVRSAGGEVVLPAQRDDGVADGGVRIAAAHPATLALGPMFGEITVERA